MKMTGKKKAKTKNSTCDLQFGPSRRHLRFVRAGQGLNAYDSFERLCRCNRKSKAEIRPALEVPEAPPGHFLCLVLTAE